VITAGGVHEKGLGDGVPALGLARKQQAPDRLGAGRAPRLARLEGGDPGLLERGDEARRLGRLAAALAAFEGDEAAARSRCRGDPRAQFFDPKTM
jgi:hypothetical protein